MTIGFKETYKGQPTHFVPKILAGLPANPDMRTGPAFIAFQTDYWAGLRAYRARPKIHTLREDNERWEAGRLIHFATGVRTKRYRCFALGICKSRQRVSMSLRESGQLLVAINADDHRAYARVLDEDELQTFAQNDGFDSVETFLAWFTPLVQQRGGLRHFTLIHWTPFRYEFTAIGPGFRTVGFLPLTQATNEA